MSSLNTVKFLFVQVALLAITLPIAIYFSIEATTEAASTAESASTAEAASVAIKAAAIAVEAAAVSVEAANATEAAIASVAAIAASVVLINIAWLRSRNIFAATFLRSRLTLLMLLAFAAYTTLLFVTGPLPAAIWVAAIGAAQIATDVATKYIFIGWISE